MLSPSGDLSQVDSDYFRQLVKKRQAEINHIRERAEEGADVVELDQTQVGRLSRMDAMQMHEMNLESQRRRKRELLALEHALKRIEDGSYGECVRCGEDINSRRLEIDLTATLCIDCASAADSE